MGDIRLEGCPVRHKHAMDVDINVLTARLDPSSPPGGSPEVYNVMVQLPGDEEPMSIVRVQPKYFRAVALAGDYRDANFEKIPEDHEADAWYAAKLQHYNKMQLMGICFGPPRPS